MFPGEFMAMPSYDINKERKQKKNTDPEQLQIHENSVFEFQIILQNFRILNQQRETCSEKTTAIYQSSNTNNTGHC